jgi:hypothetical protein
MQVLFGAPRPLRLASRLCAAPFCVALGLLLLVFNASAEGQPLPQSRTFDDDAHEAQGRSHYVLQRHVNWGLVAGGIVTLVVPYLLGLPAPVADHLQGGSAWMLVPVVGPAAGAKVLTDHGYLCNFVPSSGPTDCNSPLFLQLLLLDALVQATGAVLITVGVVGSRRWERRDLAVSLTPAVSRSAVGVRVALSF